MEPVDQLRREVDRLAARTPPPAAKLAMLDRALLPALSWGAISHPKAPVRRLCLDYLDHLAVPESVEAFLRALADPVPRVRRHAIHALTCELCKDQPLCVDVLPPLRRVIAEDPNPKVRFEALRALLSRVDAATGVAAIDEVVTRGDRDLLGKPSRHDLERSRPHSGGEQAKCGPADKPTPTAPVGTDWGSPTGCALCQRRRLNYVRI